MQSSVIPNEVKKLPILQEAYKHPLYRSIYHHNQKNVEHAKRS